MPELPEVETIRRGLAEFITHQTVGEVVVDCDKSFIGPKQVVEGRTIIGLRRRGKALLIDLTGGLTLMVHLRMTGQLIYREPVYSKTAKKKFFAGGHPTDSFFAELPDKHTRVYFKLNRGTLFFNDQRKFGFIKALPTEEVENDTFIGSLAAEPWDMTDEELYRALQRRKGSAVKAVILDQKVIAGLGNIYTDEALFYARVHPARLAGSISLKEAGRILEGARRSMDDSIDAGGSTMATYVRADGTKGDYLEKFAKVFRREGQPCVRCGTEIKKIRVAGRGTHVCPNCQVLKGGEE